MLAIRLRDLWIDLSIGLMDPESKLDSEIEIA
jgi:hypothetical protein